MTEGFQVRDFQGKTIHLRIIKLWFLFGFRVLSFLKETVQRRHAAFKLLSPLPAKKFSNKKRIILRSWFTESTFNKVDFPEPFLPTRPILSPLFIIKEISLKSVCPPK